MNSSAKILLVDDDRGLREFLSIALVAKGYEVIERKRGEDALEAVQTERPDAVLLDLGLPDLNGMQVLERLRTWSIVPVIVISVQNEESTVVKALNTGGDDYLIKPFSLSLLDARLNAVLRRKRYEPQEDVLTCAKIVMDCTSRLVTVGGQKIDLTPNEYALLHTLLANKGRVVTHKTLLTRVWGEDYVDERQLLRVHISNLRKKLEAFTGLAEYLANEVGVGYRLAEPKP